MRVTRKWQGGLAVVGMFITLAQPASAVSGDLDPSFGSGGKSSVATDVGSDDLIVQGDGKTVVLDHWDETLGRFNVDGSRDTSFGISGLVRGLGYPMGKLHRQRLGGTEYILVASSTYYVVDMEIRWQAMVTRLLASGTVDSSFTTPGLEGSSLNVAVQPDGKVVQLIAQSRPRTCLINVCEQDTELVRYLARYNADGSLDSSFGSEGKAVVSVDTSQHPWYEGSEIAIQPDGKIITVSPLDGQVLVTRHDASGTPDASFGAAGTLSVGMALSVQSAWVEVDPAGRIVVAAANCADRCGDQTSVVRLSAEGVVDVSFRRYEEASELADLMVMSDGRILVAQGQGLTMLTEQGDPDADFGNGGHVSTLPTYRVRAAGLTPDGKATTAGEQDGGTVLARYLAAAFTGPTTGSIGGRVSDATRGSPLSPATVTCSTVKAITGSDGSYRIDGLAPGEHNCTASADGYRPKSQRATVAAGETIRLDFALRKGK